MAGAIRLRFGNLFDGPCDLIVLPCSTEGTVTHAIAQSLHLYHIPRPPRTMQLGSVKILPFRGGENIAQFVAFAASVEGYSSRNEAIFAIGRALGEFTNRQPGARAISAPPLGTGAGGLRSEHAVAALADGFRSSATPAATLTVSILQREVYDWITSRQSEPPPHVRRQPESATPPRVFISHASTTEAEEAWVKDLTLFLIKNGINARLDKFHLRHGMDLPQWMCNELALAHKVVIVCNETYKAKADGRLGGVGWETMLIQGDMAKLPPDSTKYQVVVRAEALEDGTPFFLKTKYAFHSRPSDPSQTFRRDLVKELLDIPPFDRGAELECYL